MHTHIIRLGGPWEYEPLSRVWIGAGNVRRESVESLPRGGRVQLPADWGATLGADFRGRVRYTRRFGLPSNLEPAEQVWLVVEGVDYFGTLALNGDALGELVGYQRPAEFPVTQLLLPRNTLTLEVELPQYESAAESRRASAAKSQREPTAVVPVRSGRERLPGGPIGEVRLEIRS